ncbi:MAG: hypothetical protein LKM38_29925 [Pseudomonas veronii]|jgi:hypothetical protein|nr:hypothetical protein [Pseudomonas veronii]
MESVKGLGYEGLPLGPGIFTQWTSILMIEPPPMTISNSLAHAFPPHSSIASDTLEPVEQVAVEPDRESPHFSAPGNSPRARGDSALAQNYGKALQGFSGVPAHDNAIMVDIPPDSTFGQWWKLLGNAARSPEFLDWRLTVRALPDSIKILPQSGQVTYRVTPDVSLNAPLQCVRARTSAGRRCEGR